MIEKNRKERRERQANPMQVKPENRNGDRPAGHNDKPSKLNMPRVYTPDEKIILSGLMTGYHRAPKFERVSNGADLIEAMYFFNCLLYTNYTSIFYCQNDGWKVGGLNFPIEGTALNYCTAEFLQAEPRLSFPIPSQFDYDHKRTFSLKRVGIGNKANDYLDVYQLVVGKR
jgi:hypothetical protein